MNGNIKITIEQAFKWYKKGGDMRELALKAYTMEEISNYSKSKYDFKLIKNFDVAFGIWSSEHGYNGYDRTDIINALSILNKMSKPSAAMLKVNIIREVLNYGHSISFTKNAENQKYIWYPHFLFFKNNSPYYNELVDKNNWEKIGEIIYSDVTYSIMSDSADAGNVTGLACYNPHDSICYCYTDVGFLGCVTEEIAKHFGKYFGLFIITAMYGNLPNIQIKDIKDNTVNCGIRI